MSPSRFAHRALRGLAWRDPLDRCKKPLLFATGFLKALQGNRPAARRYLAAARLCKSEPTVESPQPHQAFDLDDWTAADRDAYLSSCVALVQYAFPDWQSSICDLGCGRGHFLRALEDHGYRNVEGFDTSITATENAIHPHVRHIESTADIDREYDVVCLIGLLDRIPKADLDAFLDHVRRIAKDYVVVSLPTYPQDMLDFFDSDPERTVLERREWWDELFIRHGFDPLTVCEPLPFVNPFVFRKRSATPSTPATAKRTTSPRFVIAFPDQVNAFRWVCEALISAVEEESVPAKLSFPQEWDHDIRQAQRTMTWAHYWQDYRQAANRLKPSQECFVTNFSLEPRGNLTPWIEELCNRPSRKITPSLFAKEALVKLGVPAGQIEVVPHGYSPEFAAQGAALPLSTRKRFRFLAVINSADPYRYGFDLLMSAYRKAFRDDDDVCLVVKDYRATSEITEALLNRTGGPEVLYYANFMPKEDLAALHRSVSAFVAPFRGEGFGMKIIDAAVTPLPLILPVYSGPKDYCSPDLVYSVDYTEQPVGRCLETDELDWNEDLTWCEVDVDHLAFQMRRVYENADEANERAARLRTHVIENFSWRDAARTLIRWIDLP